MPANTFKNVDIDEHILEPDTLGALKLFDFIVQGTGDAPSTIAYPIIIQLAVDGKAIGQFTTVHAVSSKPLKLDGDFELPAKLPGFQLILLCGQETSYRELGSWKLSNINLLTEFLTLCDTFTVQTKDTNVDIQFNFSFSAFEPDSSSTIMKMMREVSPSTAFLHAATKSRSDFNFLLAAALQIPETDFDSRRPFLCILANIASSKVTDSPSQLGDEQTDWAIGVHKAILDTVPGWTLADREPDWSLGVAHVYATLLWSRFITQSSVDDLNEATSIAEVVNQRMPPKDSSYRTLFAVLRWCYLAHAEKGILKPFEDAHEVIASLHPNERQSLIIALSEKINKSAAAGKDTALIDRAIALLERLSAEADDAYCFLNLARLFHTRFTHLLDLRDEELARRAAKKASEIGFASVIERIPLDCLRVQLGDTADLDLNSSLAALEAAKAAPPISMSKDRVEKWQSSCLFHEAILREALAAEGGTDNDQVIELYRNLLRESNDKESWSILLARLYRDRFIESQDLADLDSGLEVLHEAQGHGNQWFTVACSIQQAEIYEIRYNKSGELGDAEKAAECLRMGARYDQFPLVFRFFQARSWAKYAREFSLQESKEAYSVALDLLPRLALQSSVKWSHERLSASVTGKVVRDGVEVAIQCGELDTAIEWLEQGRSVVWRHLLQLRAPHSELKRLNPPLAEEYIRVSREIDSIQGSHPSNGIEDELSGRHFRKLVLEQEDILKEIRQLPGLEDFLYPTRIAQLLPAASGGPVIVLNAGEIQCNALILLPECDDILHIALPEFTPEAAVELQQNLSGILLSNGRNVNPHSSSTERYGNKCSEQRRKTVDEEFQIILKILWEGVMEPIMNGLAIQYHSNAPVSQLPRIWWCPTGPFTMLPIHAEGDYAANAPAGSRLSDRVISSYTPTLSALIQANTPISIQTPLTSTSRLLVVVQSYYSNQLNLPGAREELQKISKYAESHRSMSFKNLVDSEATVESVKGAIKEANWVHFACHGKQNTENPSASALILHDDMELLLSDIVKMSLPNAHLALLSACQTATGSETLPEESVHLAAGMLLAGFRGVIATMWSIGDRDGPAIADGVYERLLDTEHLDHKQAASALHVAVNQLRDKYGGQEFLRWVPFIHIGA